MPPFSLKNRRPPSAVPKVSMLSRHRLTSSGGRNARSCARRRSISPGRRAGEPLPVRRRSPAPLRREAAVHHPRHRPLQLLLLAWNSGREGGPPGRRRAARCPDTHGSPGLGRHLRRSQDHRRAPGERRGGEPQARRPGHEDDRAGLVIDALHTAERTRGSLAGVVFHSDHGAQCRSQAFADEGQVPSMAIRPGSWPVPRGRSGPNAVEYGLVSPVASARSASSRAPA